MSHRQKASAGRSCALRHFCQQATWQSPGLSNSVGRQLPGLHGTTSPHLQAVASTETLSRAGQPKPGSTCGAQDVANVPTTGPCACTRPCCCCKIVARLSQPPPEPTMTAPVLMPRTPRHHLTCFSNNSKNASQNPHSTCTCLLDTPPI